MDNDAIMEDNGAIMEDMDNDAIMEDNGAIMEDCDKANKKYNLGGSNYIVTTRD